MRVAPAARVAAPAPPAARSPPPALPVSTRHSHTPHGVRAHLDGGVSASTAYCAPRLAAASPPSPPPSALRDQGAPSTSTTTRHACSVQRLARATPRAARAALATLALHATHPAIATAAETLPAPALEALVAWLEAVEAAGPAGGALFCGTVALAELVPLLPTTPLALASGLLFGAGKGAVYVLTGNCLAATAAFFIARKGRAFAKKVIEAESSENEAPPPTDARPPPSGLAARFADVTAAIEAGSPAQQFAAVFALRATPVVPFSASNYVLGLTPIPLTVYLPATAAGGAIWATVYASVGAASRSLLTRGASLDRVVADLVAQAGALADDAAAGLAVAAGLAGLVALGARWARTRAAGDAAERSAE